MAFYYVKSGGTATGDAGRAAAARTGSFASMGAAAYYDNISDAITVPTTGPVASDSIYVSDSHTHTYAGNPTFTGSTTTGVFKILSVSDTNADSYSAGAAETRTSGGDMTFLEGLSFHGVDFTVGDDILTGPDSRVTFDDFTMTFEGTGSRIQAGVGGAVFIFMNGTCTNTNGSSWGSVFTLDSCGAVMCSNVVFSGSNGVGNLTTGGFQSGGGSLQMYGCDLSGLTGTIVQGVGSNVQQDDLIDVKLYGCELNASAAFADEDFTKENQKISFFNCSDTSAAAEYQFFQRTFGGDIEDQDDTGIHRDESTAFPGGTKVSMKVTTTSDASDMTPLVFDLPARYAELATASTDTIRIYFAVATATTLTNINCWAELLYPDGTNKQTYNQVNNRNTDIIATSPTTHTDDSGGSTWLNGASALTGHNEYYMDLDTSGDVGADSVPIIRIYLAVPSVTVYFDTTVDTVA